MILMIASFIIVLSLFFTMCLLIIGKRSDHIAELLLIERFDDIQQVNSSAA